MDALPERSYKLKPRSEISGQEQPYIRAEERKPEPLTDLRYALNRILHAKQVEVPFWHVEQSTIDEGAVMVTTVLVESDKYPPAYVDPYAMASAYMRGPWAELRGIVQSS